MTMRVWSSSGSGDLDLSANWGGTAPIANDEMLFPDGNVHSVTSDLTGLAIDADEIITDPGYSGNIGSSGSPMVISADRVYVRGSGEFWYQDKATTTTDFCVVDAAMPTTVVNLSGDTITDVVALRGALTLAGTVTNLNAGYHSNPSGDLTCIVESGATLTSVAQSGGNVTCDTAVTRWDMTGGRATQDTATVTTLNLMGGRMVYKHDTLTTVRVHAGAILDLTKLTKQLTITTLIELPGSKVLRPVGSDLVVVTNHYDMDFGTP